MKAPITVHATFSLGELLALSEALTAHRGSLDLALRACVKRLDTEGADAIRAVIRDNQRAHQKLTAAFKET